MTLHRRAAAGRRAARALATATLFALNVGSANAQEQVVARVDSALVRPALRSAQRARVISVNISGASIERALREVATQASLRLSYSSDIIPTGRRVTVARFHTAASEVIRDILRDTDLDVVVSPSGYVVLVRSPARFPVLSSAMSTDSVAPTLGLLFTRPVLRPQVMDRVLVMGTPATGAPERSLASAVSANSRSGSPARWRSGKSASTILR